MKSVRNSKWPIFSGCTATHNLTSEQLGVMYAIENCRTATYGFHTDVCDTCSHIESACNSCRNRHCPKCQGVARRRWVNARLDELLPVAYHHATITLPGELSVLSLHNNRLIYNLLFDAASQSLLTLCYDEKWLGAQIGFYGILHTWSQTLWPHVHLHFIVTAGGLTDDGRLTQYWNQYFGKDCWLYRCPKNHYMLYVDFSVLSS